MVAHCYYVFATCIFGRCPVPIPPAPFASRPSHANTTKRYHQHHREQRPIETSVTVARVFAVAQQFRSEWNCDAREPITLTQHTLLLLLFTLLLHVLLHHNPTGVGTIETILHGNGCCTRWGCGVRVFHRSRSLPTIPPSAEHSNLPSPRATDRTKNRTPKNGVCKQAAECAWL